MTIEREWRTMSLTPVQRRAPCKCCKARIEVQTVQSAPGMGWRDESRLKLEAEDDLNRVDAEPCMESAEWVQMVQEISQSLEDVERECGQQSQSIRKW